jgi:hypothetical protein
MTQALKGEKCLTAKLTLKEVEDIRVNPLSPKELSNKYNISLGQVSKIRSGKNWNNKPPKEVGAPYKDILSRFWAKVDKSEDCWEWIGQKHSNGYGLLQCRSRKNRKMIKAHRLSYELHNGPIPEGLLVLHKCDNKLCVNPDHLELGNYSKNLKDAYDRGLRGQKLINKQVK